MESYKEEKFLEKELLFNFTEIIPVYNKITQEKIPFVYKCIFFWLHNHKCIDDEGFNPWSISMQNIYVCFTG